MLARNIIFRRLKSGESEIRAYNGHVNVGLDQYWKDLIVVKKGLVVHGTCREYMGSIKENGLGGQKMWTHFTSGEKLGKWFIFNFLKGFQI